MCFWGRNRQMHSFVWGGATMTNGAGRSLVALLLAGTLLATGCLGFGSDEESGPRASDNEAGDDGSEDPTSDEETSAEVEREVGWETNEWSGTVTSVSVVVNAISAEEFSAEPTIEEGAERLILNLSVEPLAPTTEAFAAIADPSCEPATGCDDETRTEDGEASWATEDPEAGTWTVRIFKDGPGADRIEWTLTAAQKIVSP